MKKQQGFTLIEIVLVICILAILLTLIGPSFLGLAEGSRENVAYMNAQIIYNHVDNILYKDVNLTKEDYYECRTNGCEIGTKIDTMTEHQQALIDEINSNYHINGDHYLIEYSSQNGTSVYYFYKDNPSYDKNKCDGFYGKEQAENPEETTPKVTGTKIQRNTGTIISSKATYTNS